MRKGAAPSLRIDVITLFPEMFEGPLSAGIVGRARRRGILELGFVNPRDFAKDRRRTVDDRPYGGGPGMVLLAQPLYEALRKVKRKGSLAVYLSPQGRPFTQALAARLSKARHLALLCGRYEGVDERILDYVDLELSIGDYVLTGGELPAMVVTDAVARLLPGVLAKEEAACEESFAQGLLDHPHYTRPRVWRRKAAPAELLTGNHAAVKEWRLKAALEATRLKRRDLLGAGK